MDEDLPSEYDVIVVGTGMPECMIAAAAARIGKKVLHLDRNAYYGSEWASFNFDQLCEWISENKAAHERQDDVAAELNENEQSLLLEGEHTIPTPRRSKCVWNVCDMSFIREEDIPENEIVASEHSTDSVPNITGDCDNANVQSGSTPDGDSNQQSITAVSQPTEMTDISNDSGDASAPSEPQGSDEAPLDSSSPQASNDKSSSNQNQTKNDPTKDWTVAKLRSMRRKFNLDLSPKLLFSRGSLVELLISSNIARYAEFKSVTRVLTYIDGHLEQVPCSRADVFSTKHVSVAEKRMLMKLLTFALEYQKYPNEYRGYEGAPFVEFLQSKKLTPNVKHYVIHAIAMVDETTPTLQALAATQKFLESLGRYGNSPFIWPLFGSAELPQCFCRLCAVYGGIYHLKRSADHIIIDENNTCKGVISAGKRMSCRWLVMEPSYMPQECLPSVVSQHSVSRGVFITTSSVFPTEREQLTLLRLPFSGLGKTPVTVMELGPSCMVCPEGLYVVHMTMQSKGNSAKEDLSEAANLLFQPLETVCNTSAEGVSERTSRKPKVLWALFFNQMGNPPQLEPAPFANVVCTSFPDSHMDYEYTVKEVKKVFEHMFPGEEFLPRAPDPDEIVIETAAESNPGDDNDSKELAESEGDISDVTADTAQNEAKIPST